MNIKDLIWKLEQIYNKDKEIYYGTSRENAKLIVDVDEKEFFVYIN